MKLKGLVDEDFVQYKKPSMFIIAPYCSFKCDKEAGCEVCQNSDLAAAPIIEIEPTELVKRFYENPITEAVVFGGLEPFDSFEEMTEFLSLLVCGASVYQKPIPDIVIYTGYYFSEIKNKVNAYSTYKNAGAKVIIKYGRFIPNRPSRFDEVLGVELASNNQFAVDMFNLPKGDEDSILYQLEMYYKTIPLKDEGEIIENMLKSFNKLT